MKGWNNEKKILIMIFIFSISLNTTLRANANTYDESKNVLIVSSTIEYCDDDGYIISTIGETNSNITLLSSTYTKTGYKDVIKYNSKDEILWVYTLSATYNVNSGVSSNCISSSYSTTINNNDWKFSDGNPYFNSNTAYGEGLFKNKFLFVTTQKITIDISLTCDAYGNLS